MIELSMATFKSAFEMLELSIAPVSLPPFVSTETL